MLRRRQHLRRNLGLRNRPRFSILILIQRTPCKCSNRIHHSRDCLPSSRHSHTFLLVFHPRSTTIVLLLLRLDKDHIKMRPCSTHSININNSNNNNNRPTIIMAPILPPWAIHHIMRRDTRTSIRRRFKIFPMLHMVGRTAPMPHVTIQVRHLRTWRILPAVTTSRHHRHRIEALLHRVQLFRKITRRDKMYKTRPSCSSNNTPDRPR